MKGVAIQTEKPCPFSRRPPVLCLVQMAAQFTRVDESSREERANGRDAREPLKGFRLRATSNGVTKCVGTRRMQLYELAASQRRSASDS